MSNVTIEKLRQIEWARQYKWEVEFFDPPLPAPFNSFFPASDIDFGSASINNSTIDAPMRPGEIPFGTDTHHISITFYDDENLTVQTYMEDWQKSVYNKGMYVAALSSAARKIHIRYLNSINRVKKEYKYQIIPQGEIKNLGTSNSDANTFSLEFVIVGEL